MDRDTYSIWCSIREKRPAEAEDRAPCQATGKETWSLLTGANDTHIATLVERYSRFTMLVKLMVAAIGTGDVFSKGRDFAAWLGLVPKQMSTGDRTILGKISKRGNRATCVFCSCRRHGSC